MQPLLLALAALSLAALPAGCSLLLRATDDPTRRGLAVVVWLSGCLAGAAAVRWWVREEKED